VLTDDDVSEILRLIDESKLDELRIETPEFRLHVVRGGAASDGAAPSAEKKTIPSAAARPIPSAEAHTIPSAAAQTIPAPMPGTFYRAESPGARPFVEVGAHVEPDTVVCILEVMKMMNSIQAGLSGDIVEVCVEDAQLVEEGAPLFRVEPAT
jgi:acetyl-CoA carboxylase biotin carboxyl carrier protein